MKLSFQPEIPFFLEYEGYLTPVGERFAVHVWLQDRVAYLGSLRYTDDWEIEVSPQFTFPVSVHFADDLGRIAMAWKG